MKRDLLELAKNNPDAEILFNRDERLGMPVACSLNELLSYITDTDELLDYDIQVNIDVVIKNRLAKQISELEMFVRLHHVLMDIKLNRDWLESYTLGEHDVVEQTLKEFDISENEVNLEALREMQHDLINDLTY